MTTLEVGKKLVELCRAGKNREAINALYSPDIVSVEAGSMPGNPAEMRGLDAVLGKVQWWEDNHTVHSASCEGPYPNGNQFIVRFTYDVTNKQMQKRLTMDEAALYTVADDKVIREEFFYAMG